MSITDYEQQVSPEKSASKALDIIRQGAVIPAHPLALTADRDLDIRHQRALTRYYIDAGSGGLAVGVHTTQFAIRELGMFGDVLALASETAGSWAERPLAMVAGLAGRTTQAVEEARTARQLHYHAGLLSLAACKGDSNEALIEHCELVAAEIPLIGFYLQPAVGGLHLDVDFWSRFAAIDNVIAIKVAPFNRYRTLDVMRGVVAAGAQNRVSLYTGNDDHIVLDLLTPFNVRHGDQSITVRFVGGLLGHWSVWTKGAVELFHQCQAAVEQGSITKEIMALDSQVSDCNAAFFDVRNEFLGCIAGCHEVLRRQGLLKGIWCLDPNENLGPGQLLEIDRVLQQHSDLADDDFVSANLERWLSE